MPKIFAILTLVISLAASYFGYATKEKVDKLQTVGEKEHTALVAKKEELKKTEAKLKTTEGERDMFKMDLETTKATLATKEEALKKAGDDLTAANTMLATTKEELDKVKKELESVPKPVAGGDLKEQIAAMNAKIAKGEADVATLTKEKAELTTTVETLTARTKELDEKIAPLNAQIEKYKKGIIQNGLRGRVLAVNSGWGFCVLSLGDKQGAAANRILIVARNGQPIGRVKITAVETSQSVADIIASSFAVGTYIQPGDEVIYQQGMEGVKKDEADAAGAGGGDVPKPELPTR